MTTPSLPFSFELAQTKLDVQKQKMVNEKLVESINLATDELTELLTSGKVAGHFKTCNETFYFAAHENNKGWGNVYLLDSNGLQCVTTPPATDNDTKPRFSKSTAFDTVMAAVKHGGFKAEEIVPAIRHKMANMRQK